MQHREHVEVVVIGAGAAGLTAARLLHDRGVNVTVVEARDRVGGRVFTDRSWGIPIDIGASWIHGTMGNPVTDLRDEYRIDTVVTDVHSVAMYDAAGVRLTPVEQSQIEEIADRAIEEIDRPTPARNPRASMGPIVGQAIAHANVHGTVRAGLCFHLWEHFENEWGASPAQLSARWYKDTKYEGEQEVFPDGYGQLFERLAEGLDVRTGHVVRRVDHDSRLVIVSIDGQAPITADYAIVTLPLGVLKAGSVTFDPPLPSGKLEAIADLEMGTLSKTWLRFDRVFWPEDVRIIAYLGTDSGRWSSWYAFQDVAGAPVLLGLNGGDTGKAIEAMEPGAIASEAAAALQRCFPKQKFQVEGILNSGWTRDDFSRGSYSHVPPTADITDREALADPFGRLLFAGEATHSTCSQTVHGAVLTGQREARRVLST